MIGLSLARAIIPGDPVQFDGVNGTIRATITNVVMHPWDQGQYAPAFAFFDRYGKHGDSGALVEDLHNNAIGLYLGLIRPRNHPPEGQSHLLAQIKYNCRGQHWRGECRCRGSNRGGF